MPDPECLVEIDYTNHRGERSLRVIAPQHIVFARNEWHKETQWLLVAHDVDKDAERAFALKDIHSWRPYLANAAEENRWLLHCRHGQTCYRVRECMFSCQLKDNPKLRDWMDQEAARTVKL